MRVGDVIAEIMKRERVKVLFVYPLTPLTEFAAAADIRPIVVRQERVGCAMADAGGRLSSSDDVAVFGCQGGPGIENSFGAVAQAYSEGVPLVVIVPGPSRALANVPPSFNATLNFQHVTKSAETVTTPEMIVPALRRAFTLARNGRPGPCLVEVSDVFNAEIPSIKNAAELDYEPTKRTLIAPDPKAVDAAAEALDQREDADDLRGPGRALRESVARAPSSRRVARGAGRHEHGGKERVPRNAPAGAGRGRPHHVARAGHSRPRVGRGVRRRRELQPGLLDQMAHRGQTLHPQHRGRAGSQQDHSDRVSGARRCQAHAGDAAPGAQRAAARQAARSHPRGFRAHPGAERALAEGVDAAT